MRKTDEVLDRKKGNVLAIEPATATAYRSTSQVTKSDAFLDKSITKNTTYDYVKNILETSRASSSSGSDGPSAVSAAEQHLGTGDNFEEVGSVWKLLGDKSQKTDVDKMRVRQSYTLRKVNLDLSDEELLPDYVNTCVLPSVWRSAHVRWNLDVYLTIDSPARTQSVARSTWTSSRTGSRRRV